MKFHGIIFHIIDTYGIQGCNGDGQNEKKVHWQYIIWRKNKIWYVYVKLVIRFEAEPKYLKGKRIPAE